MGVEKPAANPQASTSLEMLCEKFPEEIVQTGTPNGDATAVIRPGSLMKIMDFLKNERVFNVLADLTAVDHLGRVPRFDVVYHLLSIPTQSRLRVKVQIDGPEPTLDSVTPLWGSADWLEREVWDMFGVRFAGHPNLKRILLYEPFEGHPLRKDYPIRKRQPLIGPKN